MGYRGVFSVSAAFWTVTSAASAAPEEFYALVSCRL